MQTVRVSTLSLANAPRMAVGRLQSEMNRLSTEIATGRLQDPGAALGAGIARSIDIRRGSASLTALIDGNAVTAARLEQTETTLARIAGDADGLLQSLMQVTDGSMASAVASRQAALNLDALIDAVNVSDGRRYLFGGVNSSARPMNAYADGAGAAVEAAFAARFGFPPGDPQADTITAADMTDFLAHDFAALFEQPGWSAWSNASDEPVVARIAANETIAASASANEAAIRKLAMAYTMTAHLGADSLGAAARGVLVGAARDASAEGVSELVTLRASVGTAISRTRAASERMTQERDILDLRLSSLEAVDPYEAKIRFDTLSTQVGMSYSLTARLLQLSILNYA